VHYPLLDRSVAAVVVGADTPDQVRQNAGRFAADLPSALWAALDEQGLVPRCASR